MAKGVLKLSNVKTEKKKNKILLIIIIVNVILWSVLIYLLLDSNQPESLTPAKQAYYFAMYAIKDHLKVPDTAEFEPFDTAIVNNNGGTVWEVQMWVQAENSFGMKFKKEFYVAARNEGEHWRLLKLEELK